MDVVFQLDDVYYRYPGRPEEVLQGASLAVHHGRRVGLLGNNGSGKSTLLHIGAGLIRPDSGKVLWHGTECRAEADFITARRSLGYLLQHSEDQLFCPSVMEDVAFGPYNAGKTAKEAEEMARNTLADLELSHLAEYSGSRLSGGERKLAALATILVMEPRLLFLDEPTNDLDPKARERLLEIIEQSGLPAVVISHDWGFLEKVCTDFQELAQGRVTKAEFTPHSHTHIHPAGYSPHSHV